MDLDQGHSGSDENLRPQLWTEDRKVALKRGGNENFSPKSRKSQNLIYLNFQVD